MMAEEKFPGGNAPDRASLSVYARAAASKVVGEEWHGSGYATSLGGSTTLTTLNGNEWYFTPVTGRHKSDAVFVGGIWSTASPNDGTVLTVKCIFEKDQWPVVERKVKKGLGRDARVGAAGPEIADGRRPRVGLVCHRIGQLPLAGTVLPWTGRSSAPRAPIHAINRPEREAAT
jgi:hypothetical protein